MKEKNQSVIEKGNKIKIPNEILEKMNIKPGDHVYYQLEGLDTEDTLIIKKA